MFVQERHQEIMNILHNSGKVVVKDLSTMFNVTEDCIRKDLKFLESQKLLQRTYGGAVLVRKSAAKLNISSRRTVSLDSKAVIAKKAINLIEENDTIFLDISTTNILLAEELAKSTIRAAVITNMIDIVSVLNSQDNNIKIISTGGVLCKELDGFTGSMTINNILRYKPDKCFIGSCGVNIFDNSITTFDVEDGNTKEAVINNSKCRYLVMENSKFYIDGTYKFAALDDIDSIITEEAPDKDVLNALAKTNTKII